MIFILFFCLWSRWVEGTCGKRSVAQIEACAAKAERKEWKEWKEWEKEAEIPKNEKTSMKFTYIYDTKAKQSNLEVWNEHEWQ